MAYEQGWCVLGVWQVCDNSNSCSCSYQKQKISKTTRVADPVFPYVSSINYFNG